MPQPLSPTRRLLIADDHPLIRSGMRAQLEPLGCLQIEEAWDGASLKAALARNPAATPIDLALIDLMMPGMDGVNSLLALCRAYPDVAVLVVTGLDSTPLIPMLRTQPNLRGLLDKSRSATELRRLVDLALAGVPVWPDGAQVKGLANVQVGSPRSALVDMDGLTPRLQEVAACVARGLSNSQTAEELGLTEGTVKAYLKDIFRSLGVSNRTQLSVRLRR